MSVSSTTNSAYTSFVKNQMQVQANQKAENTEKTTELSGKAKEYLKKLKEKFGNVDFIISDYSTEEEATQKLKSGKGEYNCIITPDLLEKMATDEDVAAQYEGIINEAAGQLDSLKESVQEKGLGENVQNYGISVDGDGKVNYYALLKDGLPKNYESKNGKNNVQDKNEKTTMISAGSIEELLKKLEEYKTGENKFNINSKQKDGFEGIEEKDKNEDSGVYKKISKRFIDKSNKIKMTEQLLRGENITRADRVNGGKVSIGDSTKSPGDYDPSADFVKLKPTAYRGWGNLVTSYKESGKENPHDNTGFNNKA